MVYLETKQLGWSPLITSYVATLPEKLIIFKDRIEEILIWLVDTSLAWC